MSEAIRFLHVLAQALSANTLYTAGHPATRRSLEKLWNAASALLAADPQPVFLFLGTAPIYAGRALQELHDWPFSPRLAAAGVQRLELDTGLTRESLAALTNRLTARLTTGQPMADEATPIRGVVFGMVAVQRQADEAGDEPARPASGAGSPRGLDLADELDVMLFLRMQAARGVVARAEADAVVRVLATLAGPQHSPQIVVTNRYHDEHPVNTALLAMAVARAAGVDATERQQLGVAALLHDIGMARLPAALGDQESLTDAERAQVETHTTAGAALLLERGGAGSEVAAIVAFEHHLRPDGSGYPDRRFDMTPHWASRLVACCAAYAALRAPRPFRGGWPVDRVLQYIGDGAGTVFDAEIAALVASVVRSA